MSVRKPALPDTPKPGATPAERFEFDARVRQTLEIFTGRAGGRIAPLPAGASQDEIVAKLNELIARFM